MERRRENRLLVEVPGSYCPTDGDPRQIMFGSISGRGCHLNRVAPELTVGTAIALHLGAIGPIDATVRWRNGDQAGVEFHEPLEPAIVDFFASFCGSAA